MHDADKQQFAQVVKATFDNYHRQQPMNETLRLWWEMLAEFDIAAVRAACLQHIAMDDRFPPTIAQLLKILRPVASDGHLGAEEAWAIAVRACDESETVILNDEIAQAWGICKPIMDLGDEVGARMAFKEAYQRITASATAPVKWWPSIGSDPHKRDAALSEAKRQGLLPAPQVAGLLPPASQIAESGDAGSPEGLRRLKEEMARLRSKGAAEAEQAARERQQAREAEARKKAVIAERVAKYEEKA
jgi:hypothetical protein